MYVCEGACRCEDSGHKGDKSIPIREKVDVRLSRRANDDARGKVDVVLSSSRQLKLVDFRPYIAAFFKLNIDLRP